MKLPQSVKRLKRRWKEFYENVKKPAACIFCGCGRLWWNGVRTRTASVLIEGMVVFLAEVLCRRLKCAGCGKSWTMRPPGLVPQRHYQLCVVAQGTTDYLFEPRATLSGVARALSCSRKTVKRWLVWLAGIASPAVLQWHIVEVSDEPVAVKLLDVAGLVRRTAGALGRAVLRRAAQVLCLLEGLASALCLEPPGLRSVVQAVVADRYRATTYARPTIPELVRRAPLRLGGS